MSSSANFFMKAVIFLFFESEIDTALKAVESECRNARISLLT